MTAAWFDSWSDATEAFYVYLGDNGWAQHVHCGWDQGAHWSEPQQVGQEGMCGKEWAERCGVAELLHAAQVPELSGPVRAVLALHQGTVRVVGNGTSWSSCDHCSDARTGALIAWPCLTVLAATGAGAER